MPIDRFPAHIDVTVTSEQLAQLDTETELQGSSRRALIRRYITQGLARDARDRKDLAGE